MQIDFENVEKFLKLQKLDLMQVAAEFDFFVELRRVVPQQLAAVHEVALELAVGLQVALKPVLVAILGLAAVPGLVVALEPVLVATLELAAVPRLEVALKPVLVANLGLAAIPGLEVALEPVLEAISAVELPAHYYCYLLSAYFETL